MTFAKIFSMQFLLVLNFSLALNSKMWYGQEKLEKVKNDLTFWVNLKSTTLFNCYSFCMFVCKSHLQCLEIIIVCNEAVSWSIKVCFYVEV